MLLVTLHYVALVIQDVLLHNVMSTVNINSSSQPLCPMLLCFSLSTFIFRASYLTHIAFLNAAFAPH
ncbi:hypothetical protein LENED_004095 [Lentinula edodes]|uniref:Uncharacterized protein n=1 Tax=Lentinula edodes TaxID=5353 RepID=A0A1Q3E5Z2_LENED|nr:hypothetical protein LENED_004095 [Lentinula edodes]